MYKNVAWICRWKIRTTKAQLKLNLVTTVKDNKKGFYKYLNNKGGTRRISILYRISSIIQRETFSNLLLHLDCMSPWGQMRSTEILRDLVEVIAKIFSVICQQFWLTGKVLSNGRFAIATPIYKKGQKEDLRNCQTDLSIIHTFVYIYNINIYIYQNDCSLTVCNRSTAGLNKHCPINVKRVMPICLFTQSQHVRLLCCYILLGYVWDKIIKICCIFADIFSG